MLHMIPNLRPTSMKEIFSNRMYKGPNIRSQTDFEVPRVNSVKGQEITLTLMKLQYIKFISRKLTLNEINVL